MTLFLGSLVSFLRHSYKITDAVVQNSLVGGPEDNIQSLNST